MNEVFVRRLIGLAVLLVALFVLSWLVPQGPHDSDAGLPSTTIPLASVPMGPGASPPSADANVPVASAAAGAAPPGAGDRGPDESPALHPATPASQPLPPPVLIHPRERTPSAVPKASHPADAAPGARSTVSLPNPAPAPAPLRPMPPAHAAVAAAPPAVRLLPPAPAGPLAPATSTPQGRVWFVQVGSYSDHDKAQTTVSLLQNIGYRAEIGPVSGPGGSTLQRVRLGPFPNEVLAQQAQARIAHQGYPESRTVAIGAGAR